MVHMKRQITGRFRKLYRNTRIKLYVLTIKITVSFHSMNRLLADRALVTIKFDFWLSPI